ncbi:hypothetical protein C173_28326 [Paenibacillus sp. FSL R7-277]|uniref:DUF1877 family protein n=1 Tax=Paenibacillus sp. FSL R7-277 TaxID=1227352 RepID=UPI0003E27BE4|nr:DUF1877 family protein [Paenibacillus sp. FSL R7-277]ETT59159.1 hypothetical protein C173_28326 [Paenibacillus sp. FSL R7-277]
MGMLGQYVMVDEDTLERMMEMDGSELMNTLEKLIEGGSEYYDIDKLWEELHLALTGVSASEPIEGDPLSEAVVVVHVFEVEEEDGFFACTEQDELEDIIAAMQQVDFDQLKTDGVAEELRAALKVEFAGLLDFYGKALAGGKHVIFSVA